MTDSDHLADAIESHAPDLIGEIKALRDSTEELFILLEHIWRNKDEFYDLLGRSTADSEIPETIACAFCDVDSPDSLAAALQEGWSRLQRDDGAGWNYLGCCPICQEQQIEEERREVAERREKEKPKDNQTELF